MASDTANVSTKMPLTGSVTEKVPIPEYGVVPPTADTEQLKGLLAVTGAAVGEPQATWTTSGCGSIVTIANPDVVTPFASVTEKDSVNDPLTCSLTLNSPVPAYGEVPPDDVTVQLNGLPVVSPDAGHVTVTTRGCGVTLMVADPEAVCALASVTLKDSVNVPFTGSTIVNVPVPE